MYQFYALFILQCNRFNALFICRCNWSINYIFCSYNRSMYLLFVDLTGLCKAIVIPHMLIKKDYCYLDRFL